MKIKLDDYDLKLLQRIVNKTTTKELKIDSENYIKWEDVIIIIQNLEAELNEVENIFKVYVNDVDSDFKKTLISNQIEISSKNFI